MERNNRERNQVEWVRDRDFRQGGIVVTVWKLPLHRPRFRFEVCCEGTEERVFRQFAVFSEGQGKLAFKHAWNMESANAAVMQALEYIQGESQAAEDNRIEFMAGKEQRGMDKDKPKQRPGLKQLGKLDKVINEIKNPSP